jgi:uncharacterized membrane protein YedE/YeeE
VHVGQRPCRVSSLSPGAVTATATFFASAVATAAVGQLVLRRMTRRALLVDAPLSWSSDRPQRRHIVASVIFGVGWGVADGGPGPIATQVGQGISWAVITLAGLIIGVRLSCAAARSETEPPSEQPAAATMRPAGTAAARP